MTEATTEVKSADETEVTVFDELLGKTGLPDAAIAPMKEKLVEAFKLITQNNQRIIQVNAAKASDPNNLDYLDSLWNAHAQDDPEIAEIEPKYQAVVEEYLELQAQLRKLALKHIPKVLSEDETKALRNLVNSSSSAIEKAVASAADMAIVIDNMLSLPHVNAKPEGGIMSLMPSVDSLKSPRGRKAASTESGTRTNYMTRVGDILLDGKSTNVMVNGEPKAKFNFAAEAWNKRFGADEVPENGIAATTLEEELFKHMGVEFRSVKGKDLPKSEYEFDFTKDIKTVSKQDGTETVKPVTVKVKVVKAESKAATTETPAEAPAPESNKVSGSTKEILKPGDSIKPEPKAEPKAETPKAAPKK